MALFGRQVPVAPPNPFMPSAAVAPAAFDAQLANAHMSALHSFYSEVQPDKATAENIRKQFEKFGVGIWAALAKKYPADVVARHTQHLGAPPPAPAPAAAASPAARSVFASPFAAAATPAAPAFGAAAAAPSAFASPFGGGGAGGGGGGGGGGGFFGGSAPAPVPPTFGAFGGSAPAASSVPQLALFGRPAAGVPASPFGAPAAGGGSSWLDGLKR